MIILPVLRFLGPAWFRRALLDLWPDAHVQRLKRNVDMIDLRAREIIAEKKSAVQGGDHRLMHQIAEGKDVMSTLRE